MNAALAIEFSRVTEMAALAAHTWFGRGDKNVFLSWLLVAEIPF